MQRRRRAVASFFFFLSICLVLAAGTPASSATADPSPTPIQNEQREENTLLQRHRPFYFAYGRPLSKLQLSFKTPIIKTWPLYFAYTQVMFWELATSSKPFRDFTYNPELFYRQRIEGGPLTSVDFGVWAHDSNGKAGADSRSYDSNYLRFNFEREGHRWTTRLSATLAYMHGFDDTNRDIQNHVGPVSLGLSFIQLFDAWFDKSEVALQASPGGKFAQDWGRGGYQLSWSFRLGAVRLVPAFYLQYYRGYAETLLNYDQRVNEFRGGVIF
jgi:outer membrane phospholipase A